MPWFGAQLKGGAEQLAWQVATRLAARGHRIEVLTTCCKSFLENWETNHYRPGRYREAGVVIHRFKVDRRNSRAFSDVNTRMLAIPRQHLKYGVCPVAADDSRIFVDENINSTALLNHLEQNRESYQTVVFVPYLYGPILKGLARIAGQVFLQPCLQDEIYAYLPQVERIFQKATGILYNSEGESELASRLFGPSIIPKGTVVGSGIEISSDFALLDDAKPEDLRRLGQSVCVYAKEYGDWEQVIDRYEAILGLKEATRTSKPIALRKKLREIHQMTPGFDSGDAITNQTILLRNRLRDLGYQSHIYTLYRNQKLAAEAKIYEQNRFPKDVGLIYHHSIGSDLTQPAINHAFPKCLVYHNITPAEFFRPYDLAVAGFLEKGRAELPRLSRHFPLSAGVSAFNSAELSEAGFDPPEVLPICVDPAKWSVAPDAELMDNLQDGRVNLLFVGRISPNKCQDHLVESFYHYLTMDPDARLILVGKVLPDDAYFDKVASTIHRLGLTESVVITDQVTESQLHAYYRTAHLYWSMSEHEGFGVPLIEAMWFDIPVLAYAVTAVPETMNGAGILFTSKKDLESVAALAKLCVRDAELRRTILRAQRKRRNAFIPKVVFSRLEDWVRKMEAML